MVRLHIPSLQSDKNKLLRLALIITIATCVTLAAGSAFAQLAPNQTRGFGADQPITFTYTQNFDCVDQPTLDLDFNGVLAQSDPNEMQTPICHPSLSRLRIQPVAASPTPLTFTCFYRC